METFIYKDLTKACLNRDCSKVKTLGPYAQAIGKIIESAYKEKLVLDEQLLKNYKNKSVFRGMLIDKEVFNN